MSNTTRALTLVFRQILATTIFALSLPLAAHGGAVLSYDNMGGKSKYVSLTQALSLTGSDVTSINNQAVTGYALSFSTAANSFTGSLGTGGQWGAGGTFSITEKGVGTIFAGSFSTPVAWTLTSSANCKSCLYVLSGGLTGTYTPDGSKGPTYTDVSGATVQIDMTTKGTGLYTGKNTVADTGGFTALTAPVPEPETFGMAATGLIGLAFSFRRRARERRMSGLGRSETTS
jgi:hypothetical protein